MDTPTVRARTGPTACYTVIQSAYWSSYCAIMAFSSVYLLSRGFSNAKIGLLVGISSALSALLQPMVSRLADGLKRMKLRQFTALMVGAQLLGALLLLFLMGQGAQAILYSLLIITLQLVMPLCSALGMACINAGTQLNFGLARGAGSIFYGVSSALGGKLVLWFGERSVPLALVAVDLVLLVSVLLFRSSDGAGQAFQGGPAEKKVKEKPFFLLYHGTFLLLIGVVGLFLSHNLLNVYAFQIVQPLGGDSGEMGAMLGFQSIVELPAMFCFSWMLTKADSRLWLKLSGIGFFLHALSEWVAPNMGVMYAVQIFELPGYALFTMASIYFINETVSDRERVQGQAWITMGITVGAVLASLFGGFLLDWAGPGALLCVATAGGAVGMVCLFILLKKGSRALTPIGGETGEEREEANAHPPV